MGAQRVRADAPPLPPPFRALLALIALLAIQAATPRTAYGAGLSDQIEAARQRQQELAGSISRSEALLGDLRRDQVSTQFAIVFTERLLGQVNADLGRVRTQIERATAALDRAQARHDALVEELRQTDHTLGPLPQARAGGGGDPEGG